MELHEQIAIEHLLSENSAGQCHSNNFAIETENFAQSNISNNFTTFFPPMTIPNMLRYWSKYLLLIFGGSNFWDD